MNYALRCCHNAASTLYRCTSQRRFRCSVAQVYAKRCRWKFKGPSCYLLSVLDHKRVSRKPEVSNRAENFIYGQQFRVYQKRNKKQRKTSNRKAACKMNLVLSLNDSASLLMTSPTLIFQRESCLYSDMNLFFVLKKQQLSHHWFEPLHSGVSSANKRRRALFLFYIPFVFKGLPFK